MEDYKKKYEDALAVAKTVMNNAYEEETKTACTEIFPELKDSEDDRIRKCLVDYFKHIDKAWISEEFTSWQVLAWLEKQKEQKKPTLDDPDLYGDWDNDLLEEIHSWLGHLDGKYTPYTIDDIKLTARHFVEWQKQKEQKPITESKRLANEVIEYLIKCGYAPVLKDDSKKGHFHIDIPRHEDDFWHSEEYKHCRSVLGEYYMVDNIITSSNVFHELRKTHWETVLNLKTWLGIFIILCAAVITITGIIGVIVGIIL